jgi:ferredoxin-NADP reductase
MAIPEHEFNLIDCQNITTRVKHFIVKLDKPVSFEFIPGQFITIVFEHEEKTLRRSYSIANIPNSQNTIEFAAGYVENGPGTKFLFNLHPGAKLKIQGPFGRLILKDEPCKRLILIGTSTGITPYRAMLDVLTKRLKSQEDLEVHLIQGVAKADDILFEQDFLNFCTSIDKAHFSAALSQENQALRPHHQIGRVQIALEKLNPNPETDLIYLCGNPNMIDDCTALLEAKGFPIQKIIREKYISR